MKRAFTLIELLVVVAVIAILAGIALPNFLEAQTRSKVVRVKADQRSVATALEAYRVDEGRYPPSTLIPPFRRLRPLTSPVAYMTEVPNDVFGGGDTGPGPFHTQGKFNFGAMPIDKESRYALTSVGPDRGADCDGIEFYPGYSEDLWEHPATGFTFIRYDPTNGTISDGDIWRVSDHQAN